MTPAILCLSSYFKGAAFLQDRIRNPHLPDVVHRRRVRARPPTTPDTSPDARPATAPRPPRPGSQPPRVTDGSSGVSAGAPAGTSAGTRRAAAHSEAARARIRREAQVTGRLGDHPHIVTVYGVDHRGHGRSSGTRALITDFDRVGRNDPCPCGSGKKYKHCHGKLT